MSDKVRVRDGEPCFLNIFFFFFPGGGSGVGGRERERQGEEQRKGERISSRLCTEHRARHGVLNHRP